MTEQHKHPAQIIAQSTPHTQVSVVTNPWDLQEPYSTQIDMDLYCQPFKPETADHHWILSLETTITATAATTAVFTAEVQAVLIIRAPIAVPDDSDSTKLRTLLVNTFAPHALALVRQHVQHNMQQAGFPGVIMPPLQSATLLNVLAATDAKATTDTL